MFSSIFAVWTAPRTHQASAEEVGQPGGIEVVTLDQVRSSHRVKVVQIVAGHMAARQLAQLGVRVASTLLVHRRAPMGGPVLLESDGSTVAVGRGLAQKVRVQLLK